jgi:NagD protein
VILRDETVLPGAAEFVERLVSSGLEYVFLTNYPSETPGGLQARFARAGLEVAERHFYTSALATAEFLDLQAGDGRRAYVIGEAALRSALEHAGFLLTEDNPEFVVLGETLAYNMDMIRKASALVEGGARFVATNPDVAGPAGRPACGSLAAPIERITGRTPFFVGKPSAFMMRAALRHLEAHSRETVMVGDNMETDILAGLQSGLRTVLVLSGVSRREDLGRFPYRPDHVVARVDEVFQIFPF